MTDKPETVKYEDLIKRKDGLYYRKYKKIPFTGTSEQLHKEEFFSPYRDVFEFSSTKGRLLTKISYKSGKSHGPAETFYPNGQVKQKGNFKSGKLHGLYERFHINGQSEYKSKYKDGEELHGPIDEGYYKNGRLKWRANYKDEKPHGPYEEYYKNGQLECKGNYENGQLHGPYEEYYENSRLKESLGFDDEG